MLFRSKPSIQLRSTTLWSNCIFILNKKARFLLSFGVMFHKLVSTSTYNSVLFGELVTCYYPQNMPVIKILDKTIHNKCVKDAYNNKHVVHYSFTSRRALCQVILNRLTETYGSFPVVMVLKTARFPDECNDNASGTVAHKNII